MAGMSIRVAHRDGAPQADADLEPLLSGYHCICRATSTR